MPRKLGNPERQRSPLKSKMENQKNRTSISQRIFRAVAILLTWIVAYLVYARTSEPPAGHPSILGFLVAIRLELFTLGYYMAQTFARNLGLLHNVINSWIWLIWLAWLAVVGSLHYLTMKKGWVIAFVLLLMMLSLSSYQFKIIGSWW
jgi:hypothetical protein